MPTALLPEYEVYAMRYAAHDRLCQVNFIAGGDPHEAPNR